MVSREGAGRGGGLLFVAVLLFIAYLAVRVVAGTLRVVLGAAILAVIVLFIGRVLRRR